MKFLVLFATLALVGTTVLAGPISISDNNVGDIVTVGVNVQANLTSDIQSNIVNVLVAILTQIGDLEGASPAVPAENPEQVPRFDLLEAIKQVKTLTSQPGQSREQKEQIWREQVEGLIRKLGDRKQ